MAFKVAMAVALLFTTLIAVHGGVEVQHTQFYWWSSTGECNSGTNYGRYSHPDCQCHNLVESVTGYQIIYTDPQYVQVFSKKGCPEGSRQSLFTTAIPRACNVNYAWKAVKIGRCGLGGAKYKAT